MGTDYGNYGDHEVGSIIAVDFDGVLHSYKSGWQGPDVIPDPPVSGAIEWLTALVEDGRFTVCVFSSRNAFLEGIAAMSKWLMEHGLNREILERIDFPTEKPPAKVTIDDRAWNFRGVFPSFDDLAGFKPWYYKG